MPIKFTCPHCKRAMIVADSLAGKKGRCKACQQILTVPKPANAKPNGPAPSPAPPAAPKSAPPPPPPSADVEAEAAALFADEPKTEEPAEVKTIDLNCPFCDEKIQFTADLAGKRAPCPECKHIIKVPELVKKEPKDWRKADRHGPAGARLPDQPELEGAWGSATAGKVGRDTLEKVGVIPKVKPPRTLWQKVRWPLVGVSAVVLLAGFGWGGYRWWSGQTVERLLGEAVAFASAPESKKPPLGEVGPSELFLGAAEFELNRKTSKSAVEADKHFGKALTPLVQPGSSGSERDAVLTDYALALVDLAGGPAEVAEGHRKSWDDIQKRLGNTLSQIRDLDARRAALRAVSRRLIAREETPRVLTLVNQVYSSPDDEKAAALCVVALELLPKDQDKARKAVEDALKLYKDKKPPPVRAEVVALGLLVKNEAPKLPEDADEKQKANEQVGQIAALALKGEKWEEARKKANELEGDTKFRALLALAVAEHKSADAAADVEAAANAVEKAGNKSELSWSLLRLTESALTAGLPEERVQSLTESIPDVSLRGRAQLAVIRARLERSSQPIEESALDKIDPKSLSRVLAVQDLARHNTRLDSGWAKNVAGWEQPRKAFGSLGAALGIQDRSGK